jgi:hypothetical protein
MADPATQFQQAGLNVPYSYTPVETKLNPPIQLPGTGELWAGVGRTALAAAGQVGEMLQKSPLNPAVKAQMDYGIDQYKAAQAHVAWLQQQGRAGQMAESTTPSGLETIPAGGAGVNPMVAMRLLAGPPKKTPPPAPEKKQSTQEQKEQSTSPYGGLEEKNAPVPPEELPVNPGDLLSLNVPSQGGSTAALAAGPASVVNTGQSQSSDIEAIPAAQYRAQQQGGSIWSPQRPSPAPPPAPTTPMPSGTGAGAPQGSPSEQQQLAQWQAQNAHPVMASGDALNWAKNFDTGAQRATYLPHGGPGGEPAYAFHMKGGGINTVPISQMVKSGGGPLVAGQNTSATLSTSDALMNQPPPGQPPGMTLGATAQAPPGMTLGQLGQPQPGQAQQAGPPQAPGYDVAAYQMPQGPTITQTGAVNPALMAGGSNRQAQAAAQAVANPRVDATAPIVPDTNTPIPQVSQEDAQDNIFSKGYSPAELAKMSEDPTVSNFAGFTWKQDRRFGNFYAVQRSPSNIFREDRWNWGKPSWEDTATDNSGIQQELHDMVGSTPGINYTDEQIRNMSPNKIMTALNEGKRFAATKSDPASQTETGINGRTEMVKILQRITSQVEAAKKAGMDPGEFRDAVRAASAQAAERNQVMPVLPGQQLNSDLAQTDLAQRLGLPKDAATDPGQLYGLMQGAFHGALASASGYKPNPFVDNLAQEMQNLDKVAHGTPGIIVRSSEQPGSTFNVQGVQLPVSGKVSDIKELSNVFAGVPYDTMLRGLNTFTKRMTDGLADYHDSAVNSGYRVNNNQRANREAIKNNQLIPDDTNLFKDGAIPRDMQPAPKTTTTVTPPTGPHVYQDITEPGFYRATKQSAPVELPSLEEATNFAKSKPSGTYFKLQGHTYMVQ